MLNRGLFRRTLVRLAAPAASAKQSGGSMQSGKKHKLAHFPHVSLTTPASHVVLEDRAGAVFPHRLESLKAAARDLACQSICAQKIQWDARVIVCRDSPIDTEFKVFINPDVPGYDVKDAVTPMYGMWETDTALSAATAWVVRPQQVAVHHVDEYGQSQTTVLEGMTARLFLHEYDFLHGRSMLQMVPSTDFITSSISLNQQHLWPDAFPSMEARMTPPNMFFDYVSNQIVLPKGLEWVAELHKMNMEFANNPQVRS
uniref:Peptide deformylase n=1 Tax=Neobodo designis TaxID=312471 RepID=A0A7S1M546_NEODS